MINFDKASIAPIKPEVIAAMNEIYKGEYGNPSSLHRLGFNAKKRLEESREIIASTINAKPEEIIFTSGATEANNWIANSGRKMYTSTIEHHSLLIGNPTFKLDKKNKLSVETIKNWCEQCGKSWEPNIVTIALGYINSEIGTITDIREIGSYLNEWRFIDFYVDATQAYGHIPINVKNDKMDYMCVSAQKFGGPSGVGFLYVNLEEIKQFPEYAKHRRLQLGGQQEFGFRAGTENLAGIYGMAIAAEIAHQNMRDKRRKVSEIRNHLYGEIINKIPCAHLNGSADWRYRYEGNLNFRFDGYRGEELQSFMNDFDVLVSTGSACASGSGESSHVLKAIGLTDEQANSSLRFTFDSDNHIKEVKTVMEVLMAGLEALKR